MEWRTPRHHQVHLVQHINSYIISSFIHGMKELQDLISTKCPSWSFQPQSVGTAEVDIRVFHCADVFAKCGSLLHSQWVEGVQITQQRYLMWLDDGSSSYQWICRHICKRADLNQHKWLSCAAVSEPMWLRSVLLTYRMTLCIRSAGHVSTLEASNHAQMTRKRPLGSLATDPSTGMAVNSLCTCVIIGRSTAGNFLGYIVRSAIFPVERLAIYREWSVHGNIAVWRFLDFRHCEINFAVFGT